MAGMHTAKTLRHQNLHLLPEKLFPRVAEQTLRLGVDQNDLAGAVGDDHGVGC